MKAKLIPFRPLKKLFQSKYIYGKISSDKGLPDASVRPLSYLSGSGTIRLTVEFFHSNKSVTALHTYIPAVIAVRESLGFVLPYSAAVGIVFFEIPVFAFGTIHNSSFSQPGSILLKFRFFVFQADELFSLLRICT